MDTTELIAIIDLKTDFETRYLNYKLHSGCLIKGVGVLLRHVIDTEVLEFGILL